MGVENLASLGFSTFTIQPAVSRYAASAIPEVSISKEVEI
jgi:hypothetical protein